MPTGACGGPGLIAVRLAMNDASQFVLYGRDDIIWTGAQQIEPAFATEEAVGRGKPAPPI